MAPRKRARQAEDAVPATPQPTLALIAQHTVELTYSPDGTTSPVIGTVAGLDWVLRLYATSARLKPAELRVQPQIAGYDGQATTAPEFTQLWSTTGFSITLHRKQEAGGPFEGVSCAGGICKYWLGRGFTAMSFGEVAQVLQPQFGAFNAQRRAAFTISFQVPPPAASVTGDLLVSADGFACPAHSQLLAMQSGVFRDMLAENRDGLFAALGGHGQPFSVPLTSVSGDSLHLMLQMLYTQDQALYLKQWSVAGLQALGDVLHRYDFARRFQNAVESALLSKLSDRDDIVHLTQWAQTVGYTSLQADLVKVLADRAARGTVTKLQDLDHATVVRIGEALQVELAFWATEAMNLAKEAAQAE